MNEEVEQLLSNPNIHIGEIDIKKISNFETQAMVKNLQKEAIQMRELRNIYIFIYGIVIVG
jgi:hypothetical protein